MPDTDSVTEDKDWSGDERRKTTPEWALINTLVGQIAEDNKESRQVTREGFETQTQGLKEVQKQMRSSTRLLGGVIIVVVALALGASKIKIGNWIDIEAGSSTPAEESPESSEPNPEPDDDAPPAPEDDADGEADPAAPEEPEEEPVAETPPS